MVYGVGLLWCALGDVVPCDRSLGWLAGSYWWASEYVSLEDCPSLCDVVAMEGEK